MENINLDFYKVFYYVAKEKNITKASEILMISQPAITQTIKKLENELNYKLFYRTSRGVELTNYGEELFNNIKSSIECLNHSKNSLDAFSRQDIECIKIGGGITLLKHNALEGFKIFKEKYPHIKIEIVKGVTSDLLDKLNNNVLDLVLFNMPIDTKENIEYQIIEKTEDAFVANSHIFKDLIKKKFKIKDLEGFPFVLQSDVSSSRKFLNQIIKKNKLKLNNCYELESYNLVLTFVTAGLGIGFINKNHIKRELENKELFVLNVDYKIPPREIGIAYNKKNINNKYIQEFIDYVNKNK